MFTVYLIDDEPWILAGLRSSINWSSLGYEIIGESTSPTKALSEIISMKPDLVFIDIRMPGFSGLELMARARHAGSVSEFIVLSGYADFHYAKESMEHGAFAYFLKPIEISEIENKLVKLSVHLNNKITSMNLLNNSVILDRLADDKINIRDVLSEVGLNCEDTYFQVIVVNYHSSITDPFIPVKRKSNYISLKIGVGLQAFIYNTSENLANRIEHIPHNDIAVGISGCDQNPKNLIKLIEQAEITSYGRFLNPDRSTFSYSPKRKNVIESISTAILGYLKEPLSNEDKQNKILDYLKNQDIDIDIFTSIYNTILIKLEFENACSYLLNYKDLMFEFGNVYNSIMYLMQLISNSGVVTNHNITNESFKKIINYVEEHYADALTLNRLSDLFHINSTYICDLFKKYTNSSFTSFVSEIRLAKAKKLLRESNMMVADIAESVGYDIFYFNKLFKKKYSITPTQYRKG